jgi:Lrp/AsnC family transcriptional regulator, leucine-responsive regulatory protein
LPFARRIYPQRQASVTRNTAKTIDAIDAQLLGLLQRDALKPARVLAQTLHISVSSVQRRIRDLRKRGIIERVVAIVEPALVGHPITVIVDVWLEKEDVRSVNDFKRLMRDTPEVIHCYHVTGDHTFVMIVALPNMEEFSKFAARVFDSTRSVAKFRSSVVMNRVKSCGPLPV